MPRYVALLRAINVGGRTVKMDYLRRTLESLKLSRVETYIASGNVLFDSPLNPQVLEANIEGHLKRTLGYEVATFIRSDFEWKDIAAHKAFEPSELAGNVLYVAFLNEKPTAEARSRLMRFRNKVDDFHINGREIYWLCRKKIGQSEFSGTVLEKALGTRATIRNSTTVTKLSDKL